MPKYLVLIWGDEQAWEAAESSPEWQERNSQGHRSFVAEAGAAVLGGHELESTRRSVGIRTPEGAQQLVSDGPYTETKEIIGGYYVLECADLAEATRLASMLPEAAAPTSGVEIRPIRAQR